MAKRKSFPKLIGVIHLPGLAGSPDAEGLTASQALQRAGALALREAKLLQRAGFDGLIIENFGDRPFWKERVPPETTASLSILAAGLREATRLPLGLNVLRNDARVAMSVASVAALDFIRVNVWSGVAATDQGMIQGNAAFVLRERDRLKSTVKVFADVHVKHAKSIYPLTIEEAIEEAAGRAGADGVIVSGSATGQAVDEEQLIKAQAVCKRLKVPLLIGSGASVDNVKALKKSSNSIIVSSALRKAGRAGATIDPKRLKAFVKAYRA